MKEKLKKNGYRKKRNKIEKKPQTNKQGNAKECIRFPRGLFRYEKQGNPLCCCLFPVRIFKNVYTVYTPRGELPFFKSRTASKSRSVNSCIKGSNSWLLVHAYRLQKAKTLYIALIFIIFHFRFPTYKQQLYFVTLYIE